MFVCHSPVNISLVHTSFARGGGMERYLGDLLHGFGAVGDTLRVVTRKVDSGYAAGFSAEVVGLGTLSQPRLWAKLRFYQKASRWLAAHPGEATATLARVPGARMVFCGGNHLGFLAATGRSRGLSDRLEIHMERRAYATARVVVAHSELMRRQLAGLYRVPDERLVTLYPPVDTKRFHRFSAGERAALRRKFGFTDDRPRIAFPSGNHRRKGLALLAEAAARMPEPGVEIVVAGGNPPRGIPGPVRYLGYVEAMEELYAACDATAMPSRYEPFGLVYIESLLCGTPAVVPAQAGAAEVLAGEAGAVVHERLEAAELAEAIRMALFAGRVETTPFVDRHRLTVEAHVAALRRLLGPER